MKTIKEKAREEIRKIRLERPNVDFIVNENNGHINGMLMGDLLCLCRDIVKFDRRWISVEEELPEINRPVLTRNGNYITGGYKVCITRNAYADNGEFSHLEFMECETGEIIESVQFWRYIELK
jgi:hypothetical protein